MTSIQPRVPTSSGSLPAPATRALLDLVSKYANRLEDNPDNFRQKLLSASLAPRGADQDILVSRREELRNGLLPADAEHQAKALRPVVAALLSAFPAYGADRDAANAIVSLTCRALNDIPTWAVQEAAARFLKGEVSIPWDYSRAPTAPQIRALAKQVMLPVEEELYRLNHVLDAELVDTDTSEAEREAAAARWAEIRAGIHRTNDISQRTDEEIAHERSEQLRANERCRQREEASRLHSPEAKEKVA